jgi:hypothetical protein
MLNFEFLLGLPGGLEFLIIFMIVSGLFITPIAFGIYFIVKAARRKNDAKKANTID